MQKILLLLSLAFYSSSLFPMYRNSGIMRGSKIDINSAHFRNDGTLEGQETTIRVKLFDGSGAIQGNKITIYCEEFKFTGKISAAECTIYTIKSFDYSLFKRNQDGKFTVHVARFGFAQFTREALLSLADSIFIENCLSLSDEVLNTEIETIRGCAAYNKINDTELLGEIKKIVEEKIIYARERLDQKWGSLDNFCTATKYGAIGAILMYASAVTAKTLYKSKKNNPNEERLALMTAAIFSMIGAKLCFNSYQLWKKWLNPCFRETYNKLTLILTALNQSSLTPLEDVEEIIVLQ